MITANVPTVYLAASRGDNFDLQFTLIVIVVVVVAMLLVNRFFGQVNVERRFWHLSVDGIAYEVVRQGAYVTLYKDKVIIETYHGFTLIGAIIKYHTLKYKYRRH